MNVDTSQFAALTDRVDAMDRQMAAMSRALVAAAEATRHPEIGDELDRVMRGRHRARLRLVEGGQR